MESLVISNEMYQRRKHIHLFTMASQLFAFAIEVFFMGVVLIYRVLGRRFFLWNRFNKGKACKKSCSFNHGYNDHGSNNHAYNVHGT
jgi:hypothetical protein